MKLISILWWYLVICNSFVGDIRFISIVRESIYKNDPVKLRQFDSSSKDPL